MKFQIGAMTIGDILDRGLKLLLSRLGTFFTIQLIAISPVLLIFLAIPIALGTMPNQPRPDLAATVVGLVLFAALLTVLLAQIATAAILKVIAEEYKGNRVTMGAAFNFALARLLPLLGTSILAGLTIFVGMLLCIIPGILWALSYIFVSQVVVLEQLDGIKAMKRSADLTSGFRSRIFGLLFIIAILGFVIGMGAGLLELVLPSVQTIKSPTGENIAELNLVNALINILLPQLLQIVVGSYQAVCMTLAYFDLRVRKEGYDLELAAGGEAPVAEFR